MDMNFFNEKEKVDKTSSFVGDCVEAIPDAVEIVSDIADSVTPDSFESVIEGVGDIAGSAGDIADGAGSFLDGIFDIDADEPIGLVILLGVGLIAAVVGGIVCVVKLIKRDKS